MAEVAGSSALRMRTSYKLARRWDPMHTGGQVALTADERLLCTTLHDVVAVTRLDTDERLASLVGDSSAVISLACTPSLAQPTLLVAHRSQSLNLYDLASRPPILLHRTANAHDAPITICVPDPSSSLFATGDTAGVVKVWDAHHGHCTHVFRSHGAVVSCLTFDVDDAAGNGRGRARLAVGSSDGRVRIWDLMTRSMIALLEGHASAVRGLGFAQDGCQLVSGGRDKVVNVWDVSISGRGRILRSIPVFESLEALGVVSAQRSQPPAGKGKSRLDDAEMGASLQFFTAGEGGVVKLWDGRSGLLLSQGEGAGLSADISDARIANADVLVVTHIDQNIGLLRLPLLEPIRHLIGFNDEIVDICALRGQLSSASPPDSTLLAVANNSAIPRIYDLNHHQLSLLRGHSDVVLSLAAASDGQLLASGSKDQSIRLWRVDRDQGHQRWTCVGICRGHVGSVGALALAKRNTPLLASASQDRTLKLWDTTPLEGSSYGSERALQSLLTLQVHDKDINALDIAPNDRFLATGSQDRTAKVFALEFWADGLQTGRRAALKHVGTLAAHSRGVWSVRFSTHDQCIATGSADRSIKLWSLRDFSCLKTFEGHTNSVLRIDFLTQGSQLVSTASDGLVKIWNVKDELCVRTLDEHTEKVWAVAVTHDGERIYTGGADSKLLEWKDTTQEDDAERAGRHEHQTAQIQDLESYIALRDFKNAIALALIMRNSARLLSLFQHVARCRPLPGSQSSKQDMESATGLTAVDSVIAGLRGSELAYLLTCVGDWNAVAKTANVAQAVAHAVLRRHPGSRLVESLQQSPAPASAAANGEGTGKKSDTIEVAALIPYTERHLSRAQKCVQEACALTFLIEQMQ